MRHEILSVEEVAVILDRTPVTIRRWLRQGRLPGIKRGNAWRVHRDDLERRLAEDGEVADGDDLRPVQADLAPEQLQAILEAAPDAIVVTNVSGRIRFVNQQTERMFGYSRADLLDRVVKTLLPERFHSLCDTYYTDAIARSDAEPSILRSCLYARRHNGTEFPIELSFSRLESTEDFLVTIIIRDITDLKRAAEARRSTESQIAEILAVMNDAVISVDESQRIVLFNKAAEQAFHYSAEELLGKPLNILFPSRLMAAHGRLLTEFAAISDSPHPPGGRRKLSALWKDGTNFRAEASVLKLDHDGQKNHTAILREITQQRQAEAERERLIREQAARAQAEKEHRQAVFLAEVGTILASSLDYEVTFQALASSIVPALADFCLVYDQPEDGQLRQVAMVHADPAKQVVLAELERRYPLDPERRAGIAKVIRTGEPEFVKEVPNKSPYWGEDDAEKRVLLSQVAAQSYMCVPLKARGRILGAISFVLTSQRRYTLDDLWIAIELANHAALALDNARLYQSQQQELTERKAAEEELQRRVRQQAAVAELGQRALEGIKPSRLMADAAAVVATTLGVEYSQVLELLPGGHSLLLRAGVGWKDGLVDHVTVDAGSETQSGYTLLTDGPVIVEDLRAERRFVGAPLLHNHGVCSGVTVIIKGPAGPWGLLAAHTSTRRVFSTDDVNFLQAIANVLAMAVERTRAEEELRISRDQLQIILAGVADGIILLDRNGKLIYANDATARIVGYSSAKQLLDVPCADLLPNFEILDEFGQPLPRSHLPLLRALRGEEHPDALLRSLPQPPSVLEERWGLLRANAVTDKQGRVQYVIGILHDVTAKTRQDIDRALLAAIVESSEDAIASTDIDGTIDSWNAGAAKLYGYTPGEIIGQPVSRLVPAERQGELAELLAEVKRGNSVKDFETVRVRKDGTGFHASLSLSPIINTSGLIMGVAAITRDISDQVAAYELLDRRVRERTRELSNLLAISNTIASTLDLQPKLGLILNKLKETVDYTFAAISGREGDRVNVLSYQGPPTYHLAMRRRFERERWPGALDEFQPGIPVIIPELSLNRKKATDLLAAVSELPEAYQDSVCSLMEVPLVTNGEVTGLLTLAHAAANRFTEEKADLVSALASQAAIAIEHERLYDQARALAVLEERQRLARDLHDAVTQMLFSASLIGDVLPATWERSPERGRRSLDDLRRLTRGALAEMRTLLIELRPAALVQTGLAELLRELAEAAMGRSRLNVAVRVQGQKLDLPADVQIALYRIVQEALNNVARHSRANQAVVRLQWLPRSVELSVSDDGVGFNPSGGSPNHFGLGIMHERAESIGAHLYLDSQPNRGSKITVVWVDRRERTIPTHNLE